MSITRPVLAAAAILAASAQPVLAQEPASRLVVSAVTQHEEMRIDGGTGGGTAGGVALGLRLSRYISLHGEVTAGSAEAHHSYEGVFTSIAPPNSSIDEIERLGVVLRRDRRWRAGAGGAVMISFHTPQSQQLGVAVSLGGSFRDVEHHDLLTLVRLPPGWDPSRSTGAGGMRFSRTRGGLLVGLAVPVRITSRLTVAPEVRWMQTIADEDYSVGALGMRAGWMF